MVMMTLYLAVVLTWIGSGTRSRASLRLRFVAGLGPFHMVLNLSGCYTKQLHGVLMGCGIKLINDILRYSPRGWGWSRTELRVTDRERGCPTRRMMMSR